MLVDILEEHLDNASYLFERLHLSQGGEELVETECMQLGGRLAAHLEALLEGAAQAWQLNVARMPAGRPGDAYVLGRLAFESGIPDRQSVVERLIAGAVTPIASAFEIAQRHSGPIAEATATRPTT